MYVWNFMANEIVSDTVHVIWVWVPSHWGVSRNEHVDKLAKQALTISLDAEVRYADAKQRVKTSPDRRQASSTNAGESASIDKKR